MSKFADIEIDPAIVRRAARGEAKAHEIIYRAYAGPVYSICLRFTRVPAHAEDLTQDTFIEMTRSIDGFRGDEPHGTKITRRAISTAIRIVQSARRAGEPAGGRACGRVAARCRGIHASGNRRPDG